MRSGRGLLAACVLALVFAGRERGRAQTLPETPDDALYAMTQQAGVIFTGRVVAVRQRGGAGGATGVVEIEFAVQDAVRGVSGGSYTLHEWAGLWPAGETPFRVGQRYLMLLHAPSAAGLSSPVDGMDGAIPIRGGGQAQVEGAPASRVRGTAVVTSTPDSSEVMDLRWVATRVVRPVTYQRMPPRPIGELGPTHAELADNADPKSAETDSVAPVASTGNAGGPGELPALQGDSYTKILGLLRSWEKSNHAAR